MTLQIKKNFFETIIVSAIVVGSLLQGVFTQDYHHYGLMLSNALDISTGKLPYREIFIQYGFLTTLIHSIAYSVFKSTLALTCITAIFYALGLLILKKIYCNLVQKNKFGNYFLLTCYLFHPVIFLPWSNYISFPFLMYAILLLISKGHEHRLVKNFLCGFSFGLAVLAREGNILVIAIVLVIFIVIDVFFYKKSLKIVLSRYSQIYIGLMLAIIPFFIYLSANQLIFYWKIHSIDLPKVYAEVVFPNINIYKFYLRFIKELLIGVLNFDVRWFLIGFVVIGNFINLLLLFYNKNYLKDDSIAKLSVASIALLVSMLHIPEIFRFASGGILGLILLFSILENKTGVNLCIYFTIGALAGTFFTGTSGVNVSYQFFKNQNNLKVVNIEGFKGLVWPENSASAYERISLDLKKLQFNLCKLRYHFNATDNNFIVFLSPFTKFQIGPHNFASGNYSSQKFDNLRPDLDYSRKIIEGDDIIIFDYINNGNHSKYDNFVIYNSYYINGAELGIFIPKKCKI